MPSPNRVKLTDRLIRGMKPPEKGRQRVYDADHPGLSLVITPAGRKTWRYVYTVGGRGGKRDQLTLGTYPDINLSKARELYRVHRAQVQQGINPAYQKKIEQADKTKSLKLNELAVTYIDSRRMQERTAEHRNEVKRVIERELLPKYGKLKARDVTRKHIRSVIDAILNRDAPYMANRTLAYIRAMFAWGVEREHVDANPCTGIKTDAAEHSRERVLTEDEIRRFWHGLDETDMAEVTKLALRLSLVTAQRKGETVKTHWDHIDLEDRLWTIPSANTKNKKGIHRVPLSDLAIELLAQAKVLTDGSPWVFPSPSKPGSFIVETSVTRALARARERLDLPDVRPHDLRRTAATMLASSGTEREYIKRILNHVDSSVTGVYDRYAGDDEKRRYLDRWSRRLQAIINKGVQDNVVPISTTPIR